MYDCIICDPDKKNFEGKALGLLYTAVSRATTLGDENGLNSAIYFIGTDFKEDRIRNLAKKQGQLIDFDLANDRKRWTDYLNERKTITEHWINENICDPEHYLQWANQTRT